MAGMKQIKNKIKSVSNIKKMTKALEVVSTIKLQKVKKQTENYRDFVTEFLKIAQVVNFKLKSSIDESQKSKNQKNLLIVISTDKGLCGSINSKLFKNIDMKYNDKKDLIDVFAVGKKSSDFFKRNGYGLVGNISVKDTFVESDLSEINAILSRNIKEPEYGQISLFFNYFHNTITQKPIELKLLPLDENGVKDFMSELEINVDSYLSDNIQTKDITLEPTPAELQKEFLDQFVQYLVYGAVLQNKAGEFASRMLAMKNAKDNAGEVIDSLTLQYNKIRQTAITREVSEIVSAKMALEDAD